MTPALDAWHRALIGRRLILRNDREAGTFALGGWRGEAVQVCDYRRSTPFENGLHTGYVRFIWSPREVCRRMVLARGAAGDRGAARGGGSGSMSEQHEVTVYDRVATTARVTAKQIDRYLERTGWDRVTDGSGDVAAWWKDGGRHELSAYAEVPLRESFRDWAQRAAECFDAIASHEQRQPSAVLADIAKEQL